jgi:hypothetical protein
MLLELGPVDSDHVRQWTKFTRRLLCELRADPADLAGVATPDFLDRCSASLDRWENGAALAEDEFRWSQVVEPELAEYMLHGIDRCLHSSQLVDRVTEAERSIHRPFTMHVVRALVDGLSAEGRCSEHLCDQVRASLGSALDN